MKNNFQKTLFTLLIALIVFVLFKFLLPKQSIIKNKVVDNNIVIDSMMIQAIKKNKDSLLLVKKDSIIIDSVKKRNNVVTHYKTNLQLESFYKSLLILENNKNAKVQIAYYGDSMNDGDLIVQDLRKLFQEKYGGKGVGFVNIYSESARSRGSVIHNFSDNWLHNSFLKRINKKSLGISGYVAFTDTLGGNNPWVSYVASNMPSKSRLYNPTLYYGKSDSAKIYIEQKETRTEIELKGKYFLNTYKISSKSLYKLKLFFDTKSTPIYGINFATNNGVHIDNFSTRGNSGLGLTRLHYNLMQQFQKKLSYNLIILQFGTNVISSKNGNYDWYKRGMMRVVNHMHKTFTKADVLVFSVADKSKKYGTEMKTDSAVYRLLKAQYNIAKESNSSFLSLYELMGGNNAMVTWAEEKPRKANRDYTHFNYRGSKEIAKLIFDELEEGFKKYKQNKHKKIVLKDSI